MKSTCPHVAFRLSFVMFVCMEFAPDISLRSHPHTPGRYPGCFTNSLWRISFLCGVLGKFGVPSQGMWAKPLNLTSPRPIKGMALLGSNHPKKLKSKNPNMKRGWTNDSAPTQTFKPLSNWKTFHRWIEMKQQPKMSMWNPSRDPNPTWLVVSTPLKHMGQNGRKFPQTWNKIYKNIWNHQPETTHTSSSTRFTSASSSVLLVLFALSKAKNSHGHARFQGGGLMKDGT